MRDAYEYYGYDFKYYDGSEIDEERLLEWLNNFTVICVIQEKNFLRVQLLIH